MKMHELQQSPEAASWLASWLGTITALFWKFAPAPLGALVMIAVDMPKTRTELFWRLVVSFIASVMLGEAVFDFLHSLSWFTFLDSAKRSHVAAVDFIVGGSGWFLLGGAAMLLRRFRGDPLATVQDVKKTAP